MRRRLQHDQLQRFYRIGDDTWVIYDAHDLVAYRRNDARCWEVWNPFTHRFGHTSDNQAKMFEQVPFLGYRRS